MPDSIEAIIQALPYLLEGSLTTAGIVIGAMILGLSFGVPLAVAQAYGGSVTRRLANIYVWFFRGVPVLVLLFLFYFGLFNLIGLNLSAFTSAIIVLGLTSAAYQSQIFRGAIQSLPHGQLKAAKALGMNEFTAITSIILPQALRLSIPGWSNEYSIILKDSAVAFVLGTAEIMARTHFVASRTYEHLPLYMTAAVLYFILTWFGVRALLHLERKVRIPGYAVHQG
ncbi:amino acid ABC transporter permease [Desulfocurvibacter africanus]|uniref:Polar amino acid ABC transporter, inner membrane subunit n=1 Tax=Desulfocurvibacter africanus subsp. africanus str. Walvis Bay TaxID=690850 RepID=F3YYV5_DESAF|nr:amino acid ABC transporter permease [Desulfocurvibacter africanus]EGJ51931.1 polar amino acid ABC transporter, inner membrane subunit [Desulfocurvibacter africanus subsp. africanus str. Walvis Bay]